VLGVSPVTLRVRHYFWTPREALLLEWGTRRPKNSTQRPKNSAHYYWSIRRIIYTTRDGQAGRPANFVGSFLNADAAGDNSIFGADARRHEDISHNGSSGFGGNADTAEVVDLAVHLLRSAPACRL
jgi:hypothetical protein